MNRSLRAAHRRWWYIVAPLAIALVIVAWRSRPETPIEAVPEAVRASGALP